MASLSSEPGARVETLPELVGIAHTIETEAIRCYGRLAEEMRRRGELETADAFEAMAREENSHVAAVESWASGLGQPVPSHGGFRWRLPADIAASWDDVSGSALLTPYRAYAIAVDNEQRAFAFYAYLSSTAADETISREAEVLAREELRHAAVLRTWRRAAWRRARPADSTVEFGPITSTEQLAQVVEAAAADVAACHRLLAVRLREAGDRTSADLLEQIADEAAVRASVQIPGHCADQACQTRQPLALLVAAQRPLERFCEALEHAFLVSPDTRLQTAVEDALALAVSWIARIGRRIEALEATPGPAS